MNEPLQDEAAPRILRLKALASCGGAMIALWLTITVSANDVAVRIRDDASLDACVTSQAPDVIAFASQIGALMAGHPA